jgi:plasmid stability protein
MLLMRTTIRIDDELYRTVKERAARSGRTVSASLEDALRLGLGQRERVEAPRFVIRPSGSGGLRPGVDLASNATIQEALDAGVGPDALR